MEDLLESNADGVQYTDAKKVNDEELHQTDGIKIEADDISDMQLALVNLKTRRVSMRRESVGNLVIGTEETVQGNKVSLWTFVSMR